MDLNKIEYIRKTARDIAVQSLLTRREYRDPRVPGEVRVIYNIHLTHAMLCLTEAIGSGSLIYMNNSTRAQDILSNFLVKTNETGAFEWLCQSTADWLIRSFSDKKEYLEWIDHICWSYVALNPVATLDFDERYIAVDAETCERLPEADLKDFLLSNSYLVYLYTLELSFNEILSLLPVVSDDEEPVK